MSAMAKEVGFLVLILVFFAIVIIAVFGSSSCDNTARESKAKCFQETKREECWK